MSWTEHEDGTVAGSGTSIHAREGATLASASTVTLTDFYHQVSGTTQVNTFAFAGQQSPALFVIRPTGTWAIGTSGNIVNAPATATVGVEMWFLYNGTQFRYLGGGNTPFRFGVYNVKDYGATGDGTTDDTVAIKAAITAAAVNPTSVVFFPPGTYLVSDRLASGSAGMMFVGSGPWKTIIKADAAFADTSTPGATYPAVFGSTTHAGSTSLMEWRDLMVNLNGEDIIAFDMGQIDSSVIRHVNIEGGTSLGTAIGTGIKFHSPLSSSSYNNVAEDVRMRYLGTGVEIAVNGNVNTVRGGSINLCTTAATLAANRGYFDGVRIEGNTNGITENGTTNVYVAMRFENNTNHDFSFGASSTRPCVIGAHHTTTASDKMYLNISNATDPTVIGPLQGNRITLKDGQQTNYKPLVLRNAKNDTGAASTTKIGLEFTYSGGVVAGGIRLEETGGNNSDDGKIVLSVPVNAVETDVATFDNAGKLTLTGALAATTGTFSSDLTVTAKEFHGVQQLTVSADATVITPAQRIVALNGSGANRTNCTLAAGAAGQRLTLIGYTWDVQIVNGSTAILTGGSANFGGDSGDIMSMELVYTSQLGVWAEVSRVARP